jgi:hypothetical protein
MTPPCPCCGALKVAVISCTLKSETSKFALLVFYSWGHRTPVEDGQPSLALNTSRPTRRNRPTTASHYRSATRSIFLDLRNTPQSILFCSQTAIMAEYGGDYWTVDWVYWIICPECGKEKFHSQQTVMRVQYYMIPECFPAPMRSFTTNPVLFLGGRPSLSRSCMAAIL